MCRQLGCVDGDGDEHFKRDPQTCPQGTDCDDTDPLRHPGRTEDCHDTPRKDEDCDERANCEDEDCWAGQTAECDEQCDQDGDTYYKVSCGGTDCDDNPETGGSANPGYPYETAGSAGTEACFDEVDNDCNDLKDCLDASCSSEPECQPTPTPEPTQTPPEEDDCELTYGPGWFVGIDGRTCVPPECVSCYQNGGSYCDTLGYCWTPIVIDLDGDGFNLTNGRRGVYFRPNVGGDLIRTAWTTANSDDAFLVLDRNGNGAIDDGTELFGCSTPQPEPPSGVLRNGFLALAEFDKPGNGGNGNGKIGAGDAIFAQLKLWQDSNHNGVSETNELQMLSASEVRTIELAYQESSRQDRHGNKFKYRARVRDRHGAQVGRWAWDVFPVVHYGSSSRGVEFSSFADSVFLADLQTDKTWNVFSVNQNAVSARSFRRDGANEAGPECPV